MTWRWHGDDNTTHCKNRKKSKKTIKKWQQCDLNLTDLIVIINHHVIDLKILCHITWLWNVGVVEWLIWRGLKKKQFNSIQFNKYQHTVLSIFSFCVVFCSWSCSVILYFYFEGRASLGLNTLTTRGPSKSVLSYSEVIWATVSSVE